MEVSLDLKPIEWHSSFQGTFNCGDEYVLAYGLNENPDGTADAQCYLVDCIKLREKHKLVNDTRDSFGNFESIDEAKRACEAHFRELMLKAFLQPV